ncbi:hypothetical protein SynMVIR181_02771 [Synechococcus sp. MVIR-18-1]|nr:hypothetical protein SynMVIR181_02771 [Synechococcus sp. MVIR-18-1]
MCRIQVLPFMVGMSLTIVCLTGIWRSNSEISSGGSTGNLLI